MQFPHVVRGQTLSKEDAEIICRNFDTARFDAHNQPAKAGLLFILAAKIDQLNDLVKKVEALDPQELRNVAVQYGNEARQG